MKIPFGLATITIDDGGATPFSFDGVTNFQGDGGSVSLEPITEELKVADFGDSVYDEAINGFNGEVKIVGASRDIDTFKQALMWAEQVIDPVTSLATGFTDSKVGTRLRDKGVQIRIHPREMADDSLDIVLYKATSSGAFEQNFENAQGKTEITLKMYPRDGADASASGNFFYIGATDPNA